MFNAFDIFTSSEMHLEASNEAHSLVHTFVVLPL